MHKPNLITECIIIIIIIIIINLQLSAGLIMHSLTPSIWPLLVHSNYIMLKMELSELSVFNNH